MNRKVTLILALLILAVISLSIVTAGNDTSEPLAADDDSSDDALSQDNDDKEMAVDDKPVLGVENFTVKMKWIDDNNAAGKRPQTVTVVVNVGVDTKDIVLSEANHWNDLVKGLGTVDENSISLQDVKVDGYTTQISGNPKDGYVITNTYIDNSDDKPTNTTDDNKKKDSTDDKDSKKETTIIKKTTTTTTKEVPVKKEAKEVKNESKKDPNKEKLKHDTGNPILLGVLAVALVGLAYALYRRE